MAHLLHALHATWMYDICNQNTGGITFKSKICREIAVVRKTCKHLVLLTMQRSTAWFPRSVKDLTDQMKETTERCDHRDCT